MTEWADRAQALADELTSSGDLSTRQWRDAVCSVPRHTLVPCFYTQNDDTTWRKVDGNSGDTEAWLTTIYSDTTLITALADLPRGGQLAVSSSTMPSLMVSMLEALNIQDGDRVLEIGTGTGYNAGLLAHRLGDDKVFSVDVDEQLVGLARERLASIGYAPTLTARDGDQGLTEHAEYDRIVSTCAVPAIPRPWIEQTRRGGTILADFKPSGMAGNLVLLRRQDDSTATGRFLPTWAGFMDMRHTSAASRPPQPRRAHTYTRERRTSAPLHPWLHPVPWFLAQFGMPENLTFGQSVDNTTAEAGDTYLSATDGSWCEVSATEDADHTRSVIEGGPVSLWAKFEDAYEQWRSAGEPDWPRFGLTVTPESHTVWLDEPTGSMRWSLPEVVDPRRSG